MRPGDFSLAALHAALDAERMARGLSWTVATREMRVSPSTVRGLRTGSVAEGDGVLQMLRWLDRTPESFVPGGPLAEPELAGARLPGLPPGQILRFDTRRLHAALEARRAERALSWAEVSRELGIGVSSLTRLSNGGRTAFPEVMRMVGWLGRPAAEFTRGADR